MDSNYILSIAEIFYETGEIKFRYSRMLSEDGEKWIRHGSWTAYHQNGNIASEGNYLNGAEDGLWRDYHDNGVLAAEGHYENGKETGIWKYWNKNGDLEPEEESE